MGKLVRIDLDTAGKLRQVSVSRGEYDPHGTGFLKGDDTLATPTFRTPACARAGEGRTPGIVSRNTLARILSEGSGRLGHEI